MSLHIAIFDCDTPVPNVYAERGRYSNIFAVFLKDAYSKTPGLPELDLKFSSYNSVLSELPTEESLLGINAIILTGSGASAYDPAPWIITLTSFTKHLYTHHPHIKIFGSCFGHQLLCHALFSTPTRCVVRHDWAGWELGVHPITLSAPFLAQYGPVTSNPSNQFQLRLQFVHADHVVLRELPKGWHSVGSSVHCVLQGVWERGRVLTYQGHAEFDRFINGETITEFGKMVWTNAFMGMAIRAVDRDDDAVWAAGVMLRFFLEDAAEAEVGDHRVEEMRMVDEEVVTKL